MTSFARTFGVALLAALLVAGCDLLDAQSEEGSQADYVVESYQVAEEPLAPVRLTETAPLEEQYDANELAIQGAEVAVELLDEEGSVDERYAYAEDPDTVGVYRAEDEEATVRPLREYRLDVRIPDDGADITSTTVVPDTFSVVEASQTEAVYQCDDQQISYSVTPSEYPGRDQAFYIFSTEALGDLEEDRLTPFYAEGLERGDLQLDDVRITSSPVLNEQSYEVEERGTIRIQLPWLSIAFYDSNLTSASAIDDNLRDFQRTQGAQQAGAGLTPGEIPNVIDHVDGGTGVFGSMARESRAVRILREGDC